MTLHSLPKKPTIGRVVHYALADRKAVKLVPAIIVDVLEGGRVDLFVMSSHATCGGSIPDTGRFSRSVPYREKPEPGCWSWPPLV
jgi:hypothetical protein